MVVFDTDSSMTVEQECLHDSITASRPEYLDGVHMVACPCPKCTFR